MRGSASMRSIRYRDMVAERSSRRMAMTTLLPCWAR